jgi:hypothetical protein
VRARLRQAVTVFPQVSCTRAVFPKVRLRLVQGPHIFGWTAANFELSMYVPPHDASCLGTW